MDRQKTARRIAISVILFCFPVLGHAAKVGERLLPADTLAVATVSSADQMRRAWQESSFGAIASDPQFTPFIAQVGSQITRQFRPLQDRLGVDLVELWQEASGELTLGVVPSEESGSAVILVAQVAGDGLDGTPLVHSWEERFRERGATSVEFDVDGTPIRSWRATTDSITFATVDGHLVVSDQMPALLSGVKRLRDDQTTDSLEANPHYREARGRLQHESAAPLRWYLDPGAVVTAAAGGMNEQAQPPLVRQLLAASGIDGFQAYAGSLDLAAGEVDSSIRTVGLIDQPSQGILGAFALSPTKQEPPAWVADDSVLYAQINWDLDRALQAITEVAGGNPVSPARPQAGEDLLPAAPVWTRDLLGQMKGSMHVVAGAVTELEDLSDQPFLIAFDVVDAEKVRQSLREWAEGSGAVSESVAGEELIKLPLPGLPGAGAEIAMAVADGSWMVSNQPQYLASTLANRGRKRPLAQSAVYRRVAEKFPEATGMISYQRQDRRFASLYRSLRGEQGEGLKLYGQLLGIDFSSLPPFSAMSRYLQTSGSYIEPTEFGFQSHSFGLTPREQ